jgi:hypothetical protein
LDGAVRHGYREVCFAAAGLSREDEPATVGDEVSGEKRAKEGKAQGRLQREVEVVDGLEEWEMSAACEPPEARLLSLRDLLGDEDSQKVATGPALLLGARGEVAPNAARVGEMKALEQIVDRDVGGVHERSSC